MVIRFEGLELPPGLTAEDMAYVATAGEAHNYGAGWEDGWRYARDAARVALAHAQLHAIPWASDGASEEGGTEVGSEVSLVVLSKPEP